MAGPRGQRCRPDVIRCKFRSLTIACHPGRDLRTCPPVPPPTGLAADVVGRAARSSSRRARRRDRAAPPRPAGSRRTTPASGARRPRRAHAGRRRLARRGRPRRRDRGVGSRPLRSASSPRAGRSKPGARASHGRPMPSAPPNYLRRHGLHSIPVVAVADAARRRRTARSSARSSSATGCAARGSHVDAVDLFSGGVHARRSRLVYRIAFGPDGRGRRLRRARRAATTLERWWTTSEGAKAVLGEAARPGMDEVLLLPPAPRRRTPERAPAPQVAGLSGSPRSRAPAVQRGSSPRHGEPPCPPAAPCSPCSPPPRPAPASRRRPLPSARSSTCRSSTAAAARRSRRGAIAAPATSPAGPATATRCA